MAKHLFLDVETLGVSSNAVLLSLGLVAADLSEDFTFSDLLENSFYVKFDVKSQKEMGRQMDPDTIEWWKRQDKEIFDSQVRIKSTDVTLEDGINQAARWIMSVDGYDRKNGFVWTRGGMDNCILEDITRSLDRSPLFPYYLVRDVRTAVDLLYGSDRGYVPIEPEVRDQIPYNKWHDPVFDAAMNAIMLRYGQEV